QLTSRDNFKRDYGLKEQIKRAAVSIMNNISEGFERDNNKEYNNFLGYAKGSAGEVRSMLYVALDLNYISKVEFDDNYKKAVNIIMQISNFKKYLFNYSVKEKFKTVKSIILHIIKIN
ncbi:MAG TPA: hypothetical protein DCE80_15795, partial [Ignavibacteriales bacterium]|nr:hypothetical protein [Ignavibacteriales bacterium]